MANSVWRRPEDEPADRQVCNIASCQGFLCTFIVCNVPYFREAKAWIDLFATKEAGEIYKADTVTAWMPAELIPPLPDEFMRVAEAVRQREADADEEKQKAETTAPTAKQEVRHRWKNWLYAVLHR